MLLFCLHKNLANIHVSFSVSELWNACRRAYINWHIAFINILLILSVSICLWLWIIVIEMCRVMLPFSVLLHICCVDSSPWLEVLHLNFFHLASQRSDFLLDYVIELICFFIKFMRWRFSGNKHKTAVFSDTGRRLVSVLTINLAWRSNTSLPRAWTGRTFWTIWSLFLLELFNTL